VIVAVIHFVVGDGPIGAQQASGIPDTPIGRFIKEALLLSQEWHYKYLQLVYLLSLPALAWMLRVLLGRKSQRNTMEFYALCLFVFGQVYLIQAACILLVYALKGTGFDIAFAVISGAAPFIYMLWATAQFSRGGRVRAVLTCLLAFLIYSTLILLVLASLAAGWMAARAFVFW